MQTFINYAKEQAYFKSTNENLSMAEIESIIKDTITLLRLHKNKRYLRELVEGSESSVWCYCQENEVD